jgi:hypothetical protein
MLFSSPIGHPNDLRQKLRSRAMLCRMLEMLALTAAIVATVVAATLLGLVS